MKFGTPNQAISMCQGKAVLKLDAVFSKSPKGGESLANLQD
jgi:hypothetical protein